MRNITIANIFLFITILCMAISVQLGDMRSFFFSVIATAMAGAVRHGELERTNRVHHRR